jgi:hypothetical protein
VDGRHKLTKSASDDLPKPRQGETQLALIPDLEVNRLGVAFDHEDAQVAASRLWHAGWATTVWQPAPVRSPAWRPSQPVGQGTARYPRLIVSWLQVRSVGRLLAAGSATPTPQDPTGLVTACTTTLHQFLLREAQPTADSVRYTETCGVALW